MKNWDDFRVMLAVARGGSVSAAARALGVNHSTVLRRIAALEHRLGVRLFDRLPSGYALTDAGADAVAAAQDMENAAFVLDRSVGARDRSAIGTLTVTAPLMIVMGPFAGAIAGFRKQYPEIDLRIIASNDLLNLHRREADVAIRATDEPDPSLFGLRLTEQRAAIYASPAYLADHKADFTGPSTDADLDWIGHVDQTQPPPEILDVFPRLRISVRLDDKLGVLAAAKAGLGLCRLPCFQGDTDSGLARVPGLPLARYPDKWVLTHPDLKSVERVRLFMRAASQTIKRLRPLFLGERPAPS